MSAELPSYCDWCGEDEDDGDHSLCLRLRAHGYTVEDLEASNPYR